MKKNKVFKMLLLLLAWLTLPNQIFSQGVLQIKSLEGFDTLNVLVEDLSPDLEQAGLTRAQIKTDVEIKLHRVGFKIPSIEKGFFTPYIYLHISVGAPKTNSGFFSFTVKTALRQEIVLKRNKSITLFAPTWETTAGGVGTDKIREIRDVISDQVDEFINDYLKANTSTAKQSVNPQPSYIPSPPAVKAKQDDSPFTAIYVGGNKQPEVEVFNDSNRTHFIWI
ncbi:MAG: hypothetical protein H0V31_09095 [Acidobacteria bacterium]|nr:hypothetical protein [Acidobacteriota bacterium]